MRIENIAEQHRLSFHDEDEAHMKIAKNTFSQGRNDVDVERDRIYRGFDDTTKAALNHYDFDLRNHAIRIRIPIETYGNIAQMPLNEETSAIYNLIQELRDNYTADVVALDLGTWLDYLEMYNVRYEEFVQNSYNEDIAKTELKMKEVRVEIDTIVRQLFDRIEALILIDGETKYVDFVKRLNRITEKYSNTLAQRQGIAKAQKDKKEEDKINDNPTEN